MNYSPAFPGRFPEPARITDRAGFRREHRLVVPPPDGSGGPNPETAFSSSMKKAPPFPGRGLFWIASKRLLRRAVGRGPAGPPVIHGVDRAADGDGLGKAGDGRSLARPERAIPVPIAVGRSIDVVLTPDAGGDCARPQIDQRAAVIAVDAAAPVLMEARKIFHAAAVLDSGNGGDVPRHQGEIVARIRRGRRTAAGGQGRN